MRFLCSVTSLAIVLIGPAALAETRTPVVPTDSGAVPIPRPVLTDLEPAVAEQVRDFEDAVERLAGEIRDGGADAPASGALASAFGDLGRLYQAYGLMESAEAAYENALQLDPVDPRWPYLQAVVLQDAGRLEDALVRFGTSLSRHSQNVAARVRRGRVLLELDRLDEARADFDAALSLDASCAAALAGLGQVAISMREWKIAVDMLTRALELAPAATRLHHPLGLAWRGLGDTEKALEHLSIRGDVGTRPPDPWVDELATLQQGERVHLLRGQLAFRVGHYEEAVKAFRTALDAQPDSHRARVDLAAALGQLGRIDEAADLFREVVAEEPENATAWFNLGALERSRGRSSAAVEAYERILALYPEDHEAIIELARALEQDQRPLEALHWLEKGLSVAPESEELVLHAHRILVGFGRTSEARRRLEAAVRADPASGRLSAALARFLATSPDPELRDGGRALALAEAVHGARPGPAEKETVALALAETGRCREAWIWQIRALAQAFESGNERLANRLEAGLDPTRGSGPCRPPTGR